MFKFTKFLFVIVIMLSLVVSGCFAFQKVSDPVFNPVQGSYPPTQYVHITSFTSGAVIHYTIDGSDPDESSPIFSESIPVTDNATIKAIAVKNGMLNSNIIPAFYNIQSSTNNPPFVNIISPPNGATFVEGDTIATIVSALDGDGNITQVEFFVDGVSKYVDSQGPGYDYNWVNVPVGSFGIRAVAKDDDGATASKDINVTVGSN